MTDLATLGLAVETKQVVKAVGDLSAFEKAASKAEKASDGVSKTSDRAQRNVARFGKVANDNASATSRMARELDHAEKSMGAMERSSAAMTSALARLGVALTAAFSAQALIAAADRFTKFENSLRVAGVASRDMAMVRERLFSAANRNGVAVSALGELYGKAAMSAGELGVTQQELLKFVDGVSAALRVQGGSVEAASGSLLQLGQALGAGIVRAEEFNSILEGAYPIAQAAARGMDGMGGSVARLRQAVADGKVTSQAFFQALLKGFTTTEALAAGMSLTVESSLNVVSNSFTRLVGSIDQELGVSSGIASGIQSIGMMLDGLSQRVDAFGQAFRANFREIAGAAVVAGTALAAAFGPVVIGAAITGLAALSSAAVAAIRAITVAMASNPIGAIAVAIAGVITAAYVFRDEVKRIFGFDVVDAVATAGDYIINSFEAAYNDVQFVWAQLPNMLGAAAIGAANMVVRAVNSMIQTVTTQFNDLITSINSILPGEGLSTLSIDPVKEFENEYAGPLEEAARKHVEKFEMIMSQSRLGGMADAMRSTGEEAAKVEDALKKLPAPVSLTTEEAKKLADQLKDLRSRADGLVEKFFPGEAARREAEELSSLLRQFGDQLDSVQRKAVEMEIGNLFKASELGLRNLDQKTKKTSKDMAEEIENTLGSTLADLWSAPIKGLDDFVDKVMSAFAQLGQANLQRAFEGLFGDPQTGRNASRSSSSSTGSGGVISQIGDFFGNIFTDRRMVSAQNKAVTTAAARVPAQPLQKVMATVGSTVSNTVSTLTSSMSNYANAIKSIESSGNYSAIGPLSRKGDRPYGAYQVMGNNIPSWTKELLGYSVSTQEFLKSKSIQDGVFAQQFGKYVTRFGNDLDAASAWLTGRPMSKAGNDADVLGTTASKYVQKFKAALGNQTDLTSAVAAGTETGTKDGLKAVASLGGGAGASGGASASVAAGQPANGGGISGGLNAIVGGLGLGYQSQSAGMGAIGGALSGFMAAGPIGAVLGGIAGAIGGIFGSRSKRKKEEKEAQRQLDQNRTALEQLFALGEGRGVGTYTQSVNEMYDKTAEFDEVAQKAGDDKLVQKLRDNFNSFFILMEKDFVGSWNGMIEAFESGLGSNSPFVQARDQMQKLSDELKNFVADAQTFGDMQLKHNRDLTPEQLEQRVKQAQEAAQKMALAALAGVEPLSQMEEELLRVKGATTSLQTTLEQLGMTAEEAAVSIDSATKTALEKLRDGFMKDITSSLNELSGVGYINDIMDAQAAYQARLKDSAALGIDSSFALRELSLSLKEIVSSAGLTREEISLLSQTFPELQFALKGWSQDTLTLADATSQLQAAYENESSALEDAISKNKAWIASIKQFRDAMKINDNSPLAPNEKVEEAAKQFRDIAAKAMGGDEEALGQLTSISQDYLDEAQAYYTSSVKYFEIWKEVDATLDKVQKSSEGNLSESQRQLDALKASVNGILKVDESVLSVKDALAQYNTALAANLDAIRTQLGMTQANNTAAITQAYADQLDRAPEKAGMDYWQQQIKNGMSVSQAQSSIADSREAQINRLYKQIFGRSIDSASAAYWMASNKTIAQIEADLTYAKSIGAFANGGTHDGGLRIVGERGPELEATGPSRIWSASQTRAMLQPANNNGDLVSELKALRQEVAALRAEQRRQTETVAYAGNQQIEEQKKTNANLADVSGELKRANASR